MDFEIKLKRLEEILDLLESGNCNFDEATKLFEEGKNISIYCSNVLEKNSGKITELVNELDKLVEKDLI